MEIEIREYSNGFVLFTAKAKLRQPYEQETKYRNFCSVNYPYDAPWLYLKFWYRPNESRCKGIWEKYELEITVNDCDDYDFGRSYSVDESNYRQKVHELLNWMRDQEMREIEDWEPCTNGFYPEL